MKPFLTDIDIFNEDIDAYGVVHHANMLKFCERARTAWLNHLALPLDEQLNNGIAYAVRRATVHYRAPLRMGDRVTIHTYATPLGRAKMGLRFEHQLLTERHTKPAVSADIEVICLNKSYQPRPLPQSLQEINHD